MVHVTRGGWSTRKYKFHEATNTAIQWAYGQPTGFFTPRHTLIGAVMTVMGRLDEEHWDIDQELEGWEPRDAGTALKYADGVLVDERIWLKQHPFPGALCPCVIIVEGKIRTCVNNQKEGHG